MLIKSDQEFITTLDTSEKLDRRITSLRNTRFISALVATFAAVGFFVTLFMCLKMNSASNRFPAIPPILTIAIFLQPAISSLMAHNELRMLLLFKKLRDDKSPVTP